MKIKISDTLFAHAKFSTDYQESKHIEWDRSIVNLNDDIVFYTDNSLKTVNPDIKNKYAWLLESKEVTRNSYNWISSNNNKFDKVLRYDKELLDRSENFIFSPVGGCWIKPEDQMIYNKGKNISIIASNKRMTKGHNLRHEVIRKINNIDVYGRGYNPVDYKLKALKHYRYSIIIENGKFDYYFTEKLIDSFITGTIPIYWGCPSIGDFFNIDGMIIIKSMDDLKRKMYMLNIDTYNEKKDAIFENFNKSKKFLIAEDYIYKKYLEKND